MTYTFGKYPNSWGDGFSQTITFIITEDCNLRCKYCYVTHKSSYNKMEFDTAKKFIDYLFSNQIQRSDGVIIEFIGGEPFIEVNLIDKIVDYFKIKSFRLNDDWFWNYRISICTNGLNYDSDEVQKFIDKNEGKLSLCISLDGTKKKHDMNRVKIDGSGSYDTIEKNVELWKNKFIPHTKATFSSNDINLLKESVIHLWNLGIKDVAANTIYENVWNKGDELILEEQLFQLADYVLDNKLFNKDYICTFFSEDIGGYITEQERKVSQCGTGKMLAVGPSGKIYPCLRFAAYSLNNNEERIIGDVSKGLDKELLRPFMSLSNENIYDQKCLECPCGGACPGCEGLNYDCSIISSLFYKTTFHCEMQKARVRANEYYFARLYNDFHIYRENGPTSYRYLYFILDENYISYCHYNNFTEKQNKMSEKLISEGLEYCKQNFYRPIFLHSKKTYSFIDKEYYHGFMIQHILPYQFYEESLALPNTIYVIEDKDVKSINKNIENCIYTFNDDNIDDLALNCINLMKYAERINLNFISLSSKTDLSKYEKELRKIADELIKIYKKTGELIDIDVLTDVFYEKQHEYCSAGNRSLALANDGNIYICPAFYSMNKSSFIGNIYSELKLHEIFGDDKQILCNDCEANQCKNCTFINKYYTKEYNISPSFQCKKSHIENLVSLYLQFECPSAFLGGRYLKKPECFDPIKKIMEKNNVKGSHFSYD